MTTGEVDITKITDREGNVLTVDGSLRIYAGTEYAAEYVRSGPNVEVRGIAAHARWDFDGERLRLRVHRNSAPTASEPTDIVRGIEAALEEAWEWCLALVQLENRLKVVARHHANLAGPSEQLLARIDGIERDATRALGYADTRVDAHEADKHPVEERQF